MGENVRTGVAQARSQGQVYGMQAKSAKRAGRLGVGQPLFKGGVDMTGIYARYKQA